MYYTESPDKWVIVRLTNKGVDVYKLLCGWYGGYTGGDEWRLSSKILSAKIHEGYVYFTNHSGSIYRCYITSEGTTGYSQQKLDYFKSLETEDTKINIITWKNYENI